MLSERMRSIDVKYVHEFTLDLLTFFYLKIPLHLSSGFERERDEFRSVILTR